jgi:hypothetical protein
MAHLPLLNRVTEEKKKKGGGRGKSLVVDGDESEVYLSYFVSGRVKYLI